MLARSWRYWVAHFAKKAGFYMEIRKGSRSPKVLNSGPLVRVPRGVKTRKMSDVSKEAAKALKGVGFDAFTNARYTPTGIFRCENQRMNWNRIPTELSAPTHLEAADWLADNHQIFLTFKRNATTIHDVTIERVNTLSSIDSLHHRDLAIIEACKIIKERKAEKP